MSKMSKAIAVLGVVAGLGVAALPLSSYAAEYSVPATAVVETKVAGAISVSVEADDEDKGSTLTLAELTPNAQPSTGNITVTVSGNTGTKYNLTMNATAMATSTAPVASIPVGTPDAGKSAWGYKIGEGAWNPAPVGSPVDLAKDEAITSSEGSDEKGTQSTTVTFGASAAAGQAAGNYSSTVTFVATTVD